MNSPVTFTDGTQVQTLVGELSCKLYTVAKKKMR